MLAAYQLSCYFWAVGAASGLLDFSPPESLGGRKGQAVFWGLHDLPCLLGGRLRKGWIEESQPVIRFGARRRKGTCQNRAKQWELERQCRQIREVK